MIAIKPSFGFALKEKGAKKAFARNLLAAFEKGRVSHTREIKRGLEALRMDSDAYIPSIGRFVQMCKGSDGHREHRNSAYRPFLALEKTESEEEKKGRKLYGKSALKALRKKTGL